MNILPQTVAICLYGNVLFVKTQRSFCGLGMLLLSGRVCREAEAGVKYVKPNHLYGFPHPALRRISIAVSLSLTAVCQLSVKTEESTQASALKKTKCRFPSVCVCLCTNTWKTSEANSGVGRWQKKKLQLLLNPLFFVSKDTTLINESIYRRE